MKRLFDNKGCYTDEVHIIQKEIDFMLKEYLVDKIKIYDAHDLKHIIFDKINLTLVIERIKQNAN